MMVILTDLFGCFAENTTVILEDGMLELMRNLAVGDRVLVSIYSKDRDLKLISSTILTVFYHHFSSIRLLDIYTTHKIRPLRLTPTHSLLVQKAKTDTKKFQQALEISIGDYLISPTLELLQVSDIKEIFMNDTTIYAPLTFEGTIVTNHSIASCYGTYSHQFMHVLTTPIRWWYRMLLELSNLHFLQKLTNDFLVKFIHGYSVLLDTSFGFLFVDLF